MRGQNLVLLLRGSPAGCCLSGGLSREPIITKHDLALFLAVAAAASTYQRVAIIGRGVLGYGITSCCWGDCCARLLFCRGSTPAHPASSTVRPSLFRVFSLYKQKNVIKLFKQSDTNVNNSKIDLKEHFEC